MKMAHVTANLRHAATTAIAEYTERNGRIMDMVRFVYRGEHFAVADHNGYAWQIYRREGDSNYYHEFGCPFVK